MSDAESNAILWVMIAIFVIAFIYKVIQGYLSAESRDEQTWLNEMDSVSPFGFERFVARLFAAAGFVNVSVTQSSGDYGADVLMRSGDGEKICIQCKKYSKKVGVSSVQEIAAAKAYYGCDVAAVATNSYFTENAIRLARSNNVLLFDRDSLKRLIRLVCEEREKKEKAKIKENKKAQKRAKKGK